MKGALLLAGGCLVLSSCASSASDADPVSSASTTLANATTSSDVTDTTRGETLPPVVVGNVTFTAAASGRSVFAENYFADILGAELVGEHSVAVSFDAQGQSDLRRPEGSCLVHEDGFVAMPMSTDLTVDMPGRFTGVLTFRLIVAGDWSLRYSCESDYSDAYVGTIDFESVGMSEYSDNYYATVLSATDDAAGNVVVRLLAHGSFEDVNDLRDPASSCLLADDRELDPVGVTYLEQFQGLYYDVTLVFAPPAAEGEPLSFLYSCSDEYTELTVRG